MQPLLAEADQILRKYQQDLREVEREMSKFDYEVKKSLKSKVDGYKEEMNNLKKALGTQRGRINTASVEAAQRADWKAQRTTILEGRVIGEDTTSSLLRTQQRIQDSHVIGTDTVIELEEQTEQMEGMLNELSTMDSVSAKTKAVIRRMQSQLVTNKVATFFIVLFELALLALIIYLKYYS